MCYTRICRLYTQVSETYFIDRFMPTWDGGAAQVGLREIGEARWRNEGMDTSRWWTTSCQG